MPSHRNEPEPNYRRASFEGDDAGPGGYSGEFSLRPLLKIIWGYRGVITAITAAVLFLFALGAAYKYVSQPVEQRSSLEFRLLFDGADRGEYPNGLAFSRSEIISTPILTHVFEMNELERYISFQGFKNGLFVLESNRETELLSLEYQAKLAAPSLTAVDRTTLEAEFRQKREALQTPQYTLNFITTSGGSNRIPSTLMTKILNDVLATWAEQSTNLKGVLTYNVRLLSPNVLAREGFETEDYIVRLDMLRGKINRLIDNVEELSNLPGALVVRVGEDRVSLAEIRANMEDLLRFKLQPLIGVIRTTGLARDPQRTVQYLESQLFQVNLDAGEARGRATQIQESLRAYMREGPAMPPTAPSASSVPGGSGATPIPGVPALIPQFGESFLDRLVAMTSQTSDTQYRQKLTDRIIDSGLRTVTLEREAAYYKDMMATARRSSGTAGDAASLKMVESGFEEIYDGVMTAVRQANQVYTEISARNLNPRTTLYRVTSPFTSRTERGLAVGAILTYGALTLVLTLILLPLGCLVHHYIRAQVSKTQPPAPASQSVAITRPPDDVVGV